ncbi:hypothetical protein WN943_025766 [Citrus x changshan-huyou]
MGRELTDVHVDKKSNGVVPNSNDASCDKVHPEVQKSNSLSKSRGPANVRTSFTVPLPFAMATEKRASGTTRHGGPKLQLKAVMCNPLCQRRIHSVLLTIVGFDIHRMEASIQKVIVGMAPKFICSERARKQEECRFMLQFSFGKSGRFGQSGFAHLKNEMEHVDFCFRGAVVQRWLFRLILRVCHVSFISMEGMVYLAIGCGFKFRVGESAALTGMALADHVQYSGLLLLRGYPSEYLLSIITCSF